MDELFIQRNIIAQAWLVAVLIAVFTLLAIVRINFSKRLTLIINAFLSNRFVDQLSREEQAASNVSNMLLDSIYILNFSMMLYLSAALWIPSVKSMPSGVLFLILALLLFAFIIAKWLVTYLVGWLFNQENIVGELLFQRFLVHSVLGLALIPLVLIAIFSPVFTKWVLMLAGVLVVLMFVARLLRSALHFSGLKRFSVKYIILYICALEILPVLILVKLVVKFL